MKAKHFIVILCGVFLLCCAGIFLPYFLNNPSDIVEIYQDGNLIRTVDISTLSAPEEMVVKSADGENIVFLSKDSVYMKSSTCPDKLCVNQGELSGDAPPIVCLPHRVVVKFSDAPSLVDGISR